MRIERLVVHAFGPFTDLALEFPRGRSDFQLIYGPNEAGKSSLLRCIRDLLFGIHAQTPDGFVHEYKNLRIAGTLCNASGQLLSFQRRKGNKNTLLDDSGNPLPDDSLAGFLGRVDRDFFTTVFGLGTDELRQGAEALLDGQGELGQALFSASLAGTPIHRTLGALDREARTLFDGRARTRVSIRPAVDSYREMLRRSKAASVPPQLWAEARSAAAEAAERRLDLDAQLETARVRAKWVERCLDALPILGQLDEQERDLAALSQSPDLDADFVKSAELVLNERGEAQGRCDHLSNEIEEHRARVAENQPDRQVLSRADAIESCHQGVTKYQESRTEASKLVASLERAEAELRFGMRELAVSGTPLDLGALRLPAADELAFRESADQLDRINAQVDRNRDEAASIRKEHDALVHKLGALPEMNVDALRAALAQTVTAAETGSTLARRRSSLEADRRRVASGHGLLPGAPQAWRETFELPVPGPAVLRQFAADAERINAARASAETVALELEEERKRLGQELRLLEQRGALPRPGELGHARERRDAAWKRLVRAWMDDDAPDKGHLHSLVAAFPAAVHTADAIADRLREAAAAVTRVEEIHLRLEDLATAGRAAESRLEGLVRERADWEDRWRSSWEPCGLTPGTPDEMQEWRDHWVEFRTRFEVWESADRDFAAADEAVEAAEALLRPLLTACAEQPLPALREAAQQRVETAIRAAGARAELQQRQAELRARLEYCEAEQPSLQDRWERAAGDWAERCEKLGFPSGTATEAGRVLLDRRLQLVEKFDRWVDWNRELDERHRAIAEYEARVNDLADAVELAPGAVEVRENGLWIALGEAKRKQDRQLLAQSDCDRAAEERTKAGEVLSRVTARLHNVMAQSRTADEVALRVLIGDLKERHRLKIEVANLRRGLRGLAGAKPLESFVEDVRAESPDALAAELDRLQDAEASLVKARDQALRDLAMAESTQRGLEQSGAEAAECLQTARGTAAAIRQDASRYLRLRLAAHFLRAQIEAFREKNQAPLLARAGALFRRITEESFEGLGIAFGQDDAPLLVGLRDGREVGVAGMSEGTRDQLYLALRLAAIEHHQAGHESMPLILDDVLVTFDDRRAQAVLCQLCELATRSQVMLFTHHRHLLDLARGALDAHCLGLHELDA